LPNADRAENPFVHIINPVQEAGSVKISYAKMLGRSRDTEI
jgi:hypothetical protein